MMDRTGNTKGKSAGAKRPGGSALILAVVLTTLLALVGVLFVMTSRVDRISTSAVVANKQLDMAVDTVIAQISQQLVLDVPNMPQGFEYYDYPDANNLWLASSEPYDADPGPAYAYRWPQVSSITGVPWPPLDAHVVPDYQDFSTLPTPAPADADGDGVADSYWFELAGMTSNKGEPVFATVRVVDNAAKLNVNTAYKFDPNGVDLGNDGSSQMQINLMALARQFNEPAPTAEYEQDLLWARANYGLGGINPLDLDQYERNVVWRYQEPNGVYTPFDVSDELEMRYRFLINQEDTVTRLELLGWPPRPWGFREAASRTTIDSAANFADWCVSVYADGDILDPNYAYRHIATTYNMDRIIAPTGGRMFNVNTDMTDPRSLDTLMSDMYGAIRQGLTDGGTNGPEALKIACQTAVSLKDYVDADSDITAYPFGASLNFYGFERPCVYLSELVRHDTIYAVYGIELYRTDANDELPVNWLLTIDLDGDGTYQASEPNATITWPEERTYKQFYVLKSDDPCGLLEPIGEEVSGANPPDGATDVDPCTVLSWGAATDADSYDLYLGNSFSEVDDANAASPSGVIYESIAGDTNSYDPCGVDPLSVGCYYWRVDVVKDSNVTKGEVWNFSTEDADRCPGASRTPLGWDVGEEIFRADSILELRRPVEVSTGVVKYIVVDRVVAPDWLIQGSGTKSLQRDITRHKCIRRLWADASKSQSLGGRGDDPFVHNDPEQIQAHPLDAHLTNIGQIGMLFKKPAYYEHGNDPAAMEVIGHGPPAPTQADVLFDLADPCNQMVFNYLTVFDPADDQIDNDGDSLIDAADTSNPEWKVAGRININTAPWYVIAQLPWTSTHVPAYELARAIVTYRDAVAAGFKSIGQLNNVVDSADADWSIDFYARDPNVDQPAMPDLTPDDRAVNDFEERDLIFSRISNLVTVRSDVFTAYILIRIGTEGPQQRVIAILDRSNVYPGGGRVRIRAVHPVPDPR